MSSTSQSDYVFIVGDLSINLLDPTAIENDFINNCHSNSLIPLINKPTRNANDNPCILDHIWSNQLYDTFNGIFLLHITDHYPIFSIVPINHKHELFRQYKNRTVTFDHYDSFKNNFTTTLRLAKNIYFQRKFTECSNNSRDTWKTLNCLIRSKKTSKDVTLNHNSSSISDPPVIAELFKHCLQS